MRHFRMPRTTVTLLYGDRSYSFVPDAEENLKGRLSCDCRRSILIRDYCDSNFPVLNCGHSIAIVSLTDLDRKNPGSAPPLQRQVS